MKYKLTSNITNTVGASTQLSERELESLTNGITDSGIITLSSGDEIIIVCDLLNRYNLNNIKYYYSGSGSVNIEVAESYGVWSSVSISTMTGGIKAGFGSYNPRWIKITHSVTTSASVYEVEVYNDDVNILFGYSGQFDSYGVDASGVVVQAIQVYNPTTVERDINIFMDNSDSVVADELLTISTSSSGVFYTRYEKGINIPREIPWDNGQHTNTETTVSGHLTLSGTAVSGTYFSPVFDNSSYINNRFFWEHYTPSGSKIDYQQSVDSESCFGVRHFNIPPSGIWNSGELSDESDHYWSISTGVLEFDSVPNNTILELRDHNYIQFTVTLTGTLSPYIYKAGIESAVTLSGVGPGSYKNVYAVLSSGTTSNQQTNLICWYKE
jgi:hypothetical protein